MSACLPWVGDMGSINSTSFASLHEWAGVDGSSGADVSDGWNATTDP